MNLLIVTGALAGLFFGIKAVVVFAICFVAIVILDAESQDRRWKKAMIEDQEFWDERAKRGFPGIKL